MKFDFFNITEYQLEITSYCNASCPQCPRNLSGSGINPYMPLNHLDREIINQSFPDTLCKKLKQIFFCGSYGDPIMHPKFLEILRDFRSKNPTLWLYIHTNGGVHNVDYWSEIAKILNGYGQIDFGIDGLEDTLSIYRKNVKYQKVIQNAKSFINAGGRAQWNFIVFKHNEHQIEKVKELAKELGFYNVLIRNTGRFFNHKTLEEMPSWEVNKGIKLETPTNIKYKNHSMVILPDLKKQFNDMTDYFNTTEISCDALIGNKVTINCEGLVLPCNFFNHNLYDARFYDDSILPSANSLSFINGKNQITSIIEHFGKDNLNIHHHSLEKIFENPFWDYVINSWKKELKDGRIFECAMTCGKKLTKVWDQGGSKR
jgi:MoaA/NifB/PqqE/SkfB family radical SAM enzyme